MTSSELVSEALQRFRDDDYLVGWAQAEEHIAEFSGDRERARMALRHAVILHEANTSVGHTHFAMPHGWWHWAADAPHTTACGMMAGGAGGGRG